MREGSLDLGRIPAICRIEWRVTQGATTASAPKATTLLRASDSTGAVELSWPDHHRFRSSGLWAYADFTGKVAYFSVWTQIGRRTRCYRLKRVAGSLTGLKCVSFSVHKAHHSKSDRPRGLLPLAPLVVAAVAQASDIEQHGDDHASSDLF